MNIGECSNERMVCTQSDGKGDTKAFISYDMTISSWRLPFRCALVQRSRFAYRDSGRSSLLLLVFSLGCK